MAHDPLPPRSPQPGSVQPGLIRDGGLRRAAAELRRAWSESAQLLLPQSCAACGAAAALLCPRCCSHLVARPRSVALPDAACQCFPVTAAMAYQGAVRACILGLKEQHRIGLARHLAPLLGQALAAAAHGLRPASGRTAPIAADDRLLLVAVPSSAAAYRQRGFWPMGVLLGRLGLRSARVLRLQRATADQAQLDRRRRRANLAGAMQADRRVRGRVVLLLDDVVTTGSTLLEARRALLAAGAERVHAAVLAATPLHRPSAADESFLMNAEWAPRPAHN